MAGLITALGGAWIAKHYDYRLAFLLCAISPLIMIYFIWKKHYEPDIQPKILNLAQLKTFGKVFFQKKLLIPMAFLFCYFLSPSFGTPLMVQMREVLQMDKMMIGILGSVGTVFGLLGYLLYFFKFHWSLCTFIIEQYGYEIMKEYSHWLKNYSSKSKKRKYKSRRK